jgi:hypothetical protein
VKKFYKITIRTRDIFNFTTSVVIKQYDSSPEIIGFYDSKEGQLVDLRVKCTFNERLILSVALSDYILRMVEIDSRNKEITLRERMVRGWM